MPKVRMEEKKKKRRHRWKARHPGHRAGDSVIWAGFPPSRSGSRSFPRTLVSFFPDREG